MPLCSISSFLTSHSLCILSMYENMTMVKEAEVKEEYDLEYKDEEDDAWYSVCVDVDYQARTLTVKYLTSPDSNDTVFFAGGFENESQVDELVCRFRPISRQVQDPQCRQLAIGTAVCASHSITDGDLRFYDAVVEAVQHQPHSFASGEEECLCTFVLFWRHGPSRGCLTSSSIASICIIGPVLQLDPRISAFALLAKENSISSKSSSFSDTHVVASNGPSLGNRKCCMHIGKISDLSQNKIHEMETGWMLKSPAWKDEGRISDYDQWNHDEDLGGKPCNIDDLAEVESYYLILINNLEKDLTSSLIKWFIYKQIAILPQAFIFPSLLSEPFATGAIMVDCQEKAQIILKFLNNPEHLIVSSRGRPWVIIKKELKRAFRTTIGNLDCISLDDNHSERLDRELKTVYLGTESYQRAWQLRNLFMEFIDHESRVCKRLVLEERRIMESFQSA